MMQMFSLQSEAVEVLNGVFVGGDFRFWLIVRMVGLTALETWPKGSLFMFYLWLSVIITLLVVALNRSGSSM